MGVVTRDSLALGADSAAFRDVRAEGVVEHMIYENRDTGYAVFEVNARGVDVVVADSKERLLTALERVT